MWSLQITPYLSLFDYFLRYFMSDVHAHFSQLGLTSDMYMVDWCVSKSQLYV